MTNQLAPNQVIVDLNNLRPKVESHQTKQALVSLVKTLDLADEGAALLNGFLDYIPRTLPDEMSIAVQGDLARGIGSIAFKDAERNQIVVAYGCSKGSWKMVDGPGLGDPDIAIAIKCTARSEPGNPETWDAHVEQKTGKTASVLDYAFHPGDSKAWKVTTMSTMADSLSLQVEKEAEKTAEQVTGQEVPKPATKKAGRKKKKTAKKKKVAVASDTIADQMERK